MPIAEFECPVCHCVEDHYIGPTEVHVGFPCPHGCACSNDGKMVPVGLTRRNGICRTSFKCLGGGWAKDGYSSPEACNHGYGSGA
jgi:hypothetical protein